MTKTTAVLLTSATLVAMGGAATYWHRRTISRSLWRWRLANLLHYTKMRVVIVETVDQWQAVQEELVSECQSLGCVGFDCEWVTRKGGRKPVALIQLATYTGLCVLIRICKMGSIPHSLQTLLEDSMVYKVGVGPLEDCKLLCADHGIVVNGALDLRNLLTVPSVPKNKQNGNKINKKERKRLMKESQKLAIIAAKDQNNSVLEETKNNEHSKNEVSNSSNDSSPLSTSTTTTNITNHCAELLNTNENSKDESNTNGNYTADNGVLSDHDGTDNQNEPDSVSDEQDDQQDPSSNVEPSLGSDRNANNSTDNKGELSSDPQSLYRGITKVTGPTKLGLSALSDYYLGRKLDKDWRVRASDWEVDHLTHRQTVYAAEDARSGIHVLLQLLDYVGVYEASEGDLMAPLRSWSSFTRSLVHMAASSLASTSARGGEKTGTERDKEVTPPLLSLD